MFRNCLAVLLAVFPLLASATPHQPLPAVFEHDRVFLHVLTPDGSPLRLYTDSGGGMNMLGSAAAAALQLPVQDHIEGDGDSLPIVDFPAFLAAAGIPAPIADRVLENRLAIAPGTWNVGDGLLGNRWFAGRIWEIDYRAHTFKLLEGGVPDAGMSRIPMHYRGGNFYWPRVSVEIDGKKLDLLLDTGATSEVVGQAARLQSVPEATLVASSFIVLSRFREWQARHPDWVVVEAGARLQGQSVPMIRVPRMVIAGHPVGPVWFAAREDRNFSEWMSSMTDAPIEGALGGSALRYFRVVLDYPAQAAYFAPLAATP